MEREKGVCMNYLALIRTRYVYIFARRRTEQCYTRGLQEHTLDKQYKYKQTYLGCTRPREANRTERIQDGLMGLGFAPGMQRLTYEFSPCRCFSCSITQIISSPLTRLGRRLWYICPPTRVGQVLVHRSLVSITPSSRPTTATTA